MALVDRITAALQAIGADIKALQVPRISPIQPAVGLGMGDFVPGLLLGGTNSTTATPVQYRCYAHAFAVPHDTLWSAAGVRVTTLRSGSSVLVGVAASTASGKPGTLMGQVSIDTSGTGARESTLGAPVLLKAGTRYWALLLTPWTVNPAATLIYIGAADVAAMGGALNDASSVNYWAQEGIAASAFQSDMSIYTNWQATTFSLPFIRLIGSAA